MKEGDKARPFVKQGTFLFAIFSISMIVYECPYTTNHHVDCCYWIKFLRDSILIKFRLILVKDNHKILRGDLRLCVKVFGLKGLKKIKSRIRRT